MGCCGRDVYPPPLGKHAESQRNEGKPGSHAYTSPCLHTTGGTNRVYVAKHKMWAKESISACHTKMCLSAGSALWRAGGGWLLGCIRHFTIDSQSFIHSFILWQPGACRGKNRIPQNHGHFKERRCMMHTERAGEGGGGGGTRPWWLALLACGGTYWPLALAPSAMTSRHPYYCGHPPACVGIQNATSGYPGGGGGGSDRVVDEPVCRPLGGEESIGPVR